MHTKQDCCLVGDWKFGIHLHRDWIILYLQPNILIPDLPPLIHKDILIKKTKQKYQTNYLGSWETRIIDLVTI